MSRTGGRVVELTENQKEELDTAFHTFDTNKSNTLDVYEFISAMKSLGFDMPKIKAKNYIIHYNAEETGLSYEDFQKIAAKYFARQIEREEVIKAFSKFDYDKDGKISSKDLICVFHEMGNDKSREYCEKLIKEFDDDEDGLLSLKEFLEIFYPTR